MKRYLIVHSLPAACCARYGTSIAASLFCARLAKAGRFDHVFSIPPTNVHVYAGTEPDEGIEVVQAKIRGRSRLSRILACLVEQLRVFRRIEKHASVWFYNMDAQSALLFLLLRGFKPSVRLQVVVADFTPGQRMGGFLLRLINRSDGMITLSDSPLFTHPAKVVLPGIVPDSAPYPEVSAPVARSFLLSGALDRRISSLPTVLEAFAGMPGCTLHITGFLYDTSEVDAYAASHPWIRYHGILPAEAFNALLETVPFVLSTRDPSFPENQCNFPSKVLEALHHNRIVVSTIHYPQLEGVRYFEVPSREDAFAAALREIADKSDEELLPYANQGDDVKARFEAAVWLDTINRIEHGDRI